MNWFKRKYRLVPYTSPLYTIRGWVIQTKSWWWPFWSEVRTTYYGSSNVWATPKDAELILDVIRKRY